MLFIILGTALLLILCIVIIVVAAVRRRNRKLDVIAGHTIPMNNLELRASDELELELIPKEDIMLKEMLGKGAYGEVMFVPVPA
jgi:hypothetical protein